MFSTLLAIALPIAPPILVVRGWSLAWQIAAVAAVWLLIDLPDLPHVIRIPLTKGGALDTIRPLAFFATTMYALMALSVAAQLRWRQLFIPKATATLFWIKVATIPVLALLSIPITETVERTGSFTGTPVSRTALFLFQVVSQISNLAFYALALTLAIGLPLLVPGILRWIRHAL